MGVAKCVCCCRRMGDAVTSNRWWDWRCGCGRSARRCGCARRPDCAERLAQFGVPLVPIGPPVRPLVHGAAPPSAADAPRLAAELIAEQFGKLRGGGRGMRCAGGHRLVPGRGRRAVGGRETGHPVRVCGLLPDLPAVAAPPAVSPLPGRPLPPDVTDNRVLNDLDVENYNALFGRPLNTQRASIGLPPVDNVRDHVITGHPWLAADPVLGPWPETADLDVVQTGAWIVPDERPLPAGLEAFLDAGPPPVYVGFGSMRAPEDIARVAIEAIRAQGRRALVARGWADLAPIDDAGRLLRRRRGQPAGTVRPGGRRRAPRRRGHHDDGRPGRRAAGGDTPDGGPAILGRPGGRPGHRRGARRSRPRPPSPCQPRSARPWPRRPAHGRPPWPARSAPTGRRWPRRC